MSVLTAEDAPAADQAAPVDAEVRDRLVPPALTDTVRSWVATGVIAVLALVLRLIALSRPGKLIFDEIYYARDARHLLEHGVEWDNKANTGSFVAHPPLGKWIIAIGEWLFGYNSFGWRIMPVVAGVVAVVIVIRLARRMFGSTVLGCAAGLLMTLDGMAFVSSRTSLLDIFLMLFVLAAFAALVADRDASRRAWLGALEAGRAAPVFRVRGWRLAAAVLLGCAMAVKWSAIWYLPLFLALIIVWEAHTRRAAGVRRPWLDALLDELGWLGAFVLVFTVVYLASWAGWFANDHSWDRHWLAAHHYPEPPVIGSLVNLFEYHRDILAFHTGLEAKHPYQSWPMQWLTLARPVAFDYQSPGGCGAAQCSREILLLGTPILWWSFIPALIALVWWSVAKRDWRGWAIMLGAAAGILPWFYYQWSDHRTMFYFYALPSEPFLILVVTMVLGIIIGGRSASRDRRMIGAIVAGGYVAAVALCFAYFYPIYVDETIRYADWYARMWLGSKWI